MKYLLGADSSSTTMGGELFQHKCVCKRIKLKGPTKVEVGGLSLECIQMILNVWDT
jgi:hypothetical protein